MTRLLTIFLAVTLAECGVAVLFGRSHVAEPGGQAAPRAVLPDSTCDLGEVRGGQPLTARFPIENRGARRLVLTELDRSCDCVRGERPEIVVGPGRSGEIRVRLETDELSGPMQLEVRYATNDPALPMITLRVLADAAR